MLKKWYVQSLLLFGFTIALLLICGGYASAASYYVNNLSGSNCSNSYAGTLSTSDGTNGPWCSFTPINATTFTAGDQILLHNGATWTGQTLTLKGNGTATNPILLSSYGSGSNPIIAPGITNATTILLNGVGGWKITNLELQNAFEGIRLQYDHVTNKDYIWIENVVIRHMNSSYNSNPSAYSHTSAGISVRTLADVSSPQDSDIVNAPSRLTALTHLTIKSVSMYDCDTGTWFGIKADSGFGGPNDAQMWIKKITMQDVSIDGGGMWGFDFHFIDGGTFTNLIARNVGTVTNPFGSAGIVVAYSKNAEFIGGEISNVVRNPAQNYDGCGFDFEGVGKNISLRDMNIHDTAGAGIFHFNNANTPDVDTVINNNVISHYGKNTSNTSNQEGITFAGGSGIVTNNIFNNSKSRSQYAGTYSGFTFINNSVNTVSSSFVPAAPAALASPAGTSLVSGQTLGTLRNDYTGQVGMRFTTGSSAMTIYGLGRQFVTGNLNTHTVALYKDSDKSQVALCSVSTSTGTADALGYKYCKLASAVTLSANSSYFIVTAEDSSGDQWYNDDTTISPSAGTIQTSGVYGGGNWFNSTAGNRNYGPVNLLYVPTTNLALGATASASGTDTANGYAASKINDGLASTDFNGWASASPVMPQWVQLDWGMNKTFDTVELYTTTGYETRGYQIQYWNGSSWVNCFAAVTGNNQAHRSHTFPAVTGSKIRIYVNQGDAASSYARVSELEVYFANPNLAPGAITSASGTDTGNGYAMSKINDGIASTDFNGWASASTVMPQWVQMDWGVNKTFSRVELYTTSGYETRDYQIQYWNGTSWIDCLTAITGNTLAHRTHTFTAVTGSKLRVYVNQGDALSSFARVNELEVYYN
ncbi:hypothetical protein Back11_04950 [Paenibacillus baekrokdamisoli]|uniref:Uncharacterized protein n=1 Tax=Paenibacillus baekrokdamisoli TaxID=1712516 RepID=A0A3G9IJR8_9BACL|nr:discoidin domain-containing protein [Paenibacillus baekrokdamisoli]MBB3067664.1 lysozyme family protein [Paenibacillus baekrokdamisoli]BBH19150.1 hypothetical protein Back11_04950 [Paenibacillus baekrokdamisoli]